MNMSQGPDIKINGEIVHTFMDNQGVQRLNRNPLLCSMLEFCQEGGYGLNEMWIDFEGDLDILRLLYQNIGYSVCGYAEVFSDDEIENSLWKRDNGEI